MTNFTKTSDYWNIVEAEDLEDDWRPPSNDSKMFTSSQRIADDCGNVVAFSVGSYHNYRNMLKSKKALDIQTRTIAALPKILEFLNEYRTELLEEFTHVMENDGLETWSKKESFNKLEELFNEIHDKC